MVVSSMFACVWVVVRGVGWKGVDLGKRAEKTCMHHRVGRAFLESRRVHVMLPHPTYAHFQAADFPILAYEDLSITCLWQSVCDALLKAIVLVSCLQLYSTA